MQSQSAQLVNQPGKSKTLSNNSNLESRINRLGELYSARIGQVALWVILLASGLVILETHFSYSQLERGVPVSLVGYIMPPALISDYRCFLSAKILFGIAALSWGAVPFLTRLQSSVIAKYISLSSWTTVVSYLIAASMFWENLPFFLHKYVLPFWLLLVYAMWYHFYRVEISESVSAKKFWTTPLYPFWVFFLTVYLISMLYTLAGISKLRAAMDWGNGLSMQLWTLANGDPQSPITNFILADRANAALIQQATLFVECLAWLSLFHPVLRAFFGLSLLAMHLAVDMTFHIDFVAHMILLFAFFMPFFEWSKKL